MSTFFFSRGECVFIASRDFCYLRGLSSGHFAIQGEMLPGLCKVQMRTADADGGRQMRTSDNYKIRKIRNDRSFSSFNLRTIACNLYPCELVLIQK